MRKLYVAPIAARRWVLTLDEDAEPTISEHATRGEAESAARSYAETFGYPQIDVIGEDGKVDVMLLGDVDPQPSGPPPGVGEAPA
jgi:hypothetical protein